MEIEGRSTERKLVAESRSTEKYTGGGALTGRKAAGRRSTPAARLEDKGRNTDGKEISWRDDYRQQGWKMMEDTDGNAGSWREEY